MRSYQEYTHLTYTHHGILTCLAMDIHQPFSLLLPSGVFRLEINETQQQYPGHRECLTEHWQRGG
ncbi:mCG147833 [Mus musculus]|nr:mCG147833 [Mus musculus]